MASWILPIFADFADFAGFLLILSKIAAVLAIVSLAVALALYFYRFYLDAQVIRPGKHGSAQAIRWKGEIYELHAPGKAKKQREPIEGSIEISPDGLSVRN